LCWCIKLGQVGIITEVLTLSSHLALPAMWGTFGSIAPSVCLSWQEAQCENHLWPIVSDFWYDCVQGMQLEAFLWQRAWRSNST
jgi:hypothetical protein